jgi:hypothetical protein
VEKNTTAAQKRANVTHLKSLDFALMNALRLFIKKTSKEANKMLESPTIQSKIHPLIFGDGEVGKSWYGIVPDHQMESRFPDHTQYIHLSTMCDIIVRESLRKYWSPITSKTLFYLHENFSGWGCDYERVEKTEWARAGLLNRTCTQSCTDCEELSKGRRSAKIECRMRDY